MNNKILDFLVNIALAQKKYAVETFDGLCIPPPWLVENDKLVEKGKNPVFDSNKDSRLTEHRCQVVVDQNAEIVGLRAK